MSLRKDAERLIKKADAIYARGELRFGSNTHPQIELTLPADLGGTIFRMADDDADLPALIKEVLEEIDQRLKARIPELIEDADQYSAALAL